MSTQAKPGGEVDAMCTKCEMVLAHTIIAMVGSKIKRVKCNTCQGEHVYKGVQAPKPKKVAVKKSGPKKPSTRGAEAAKEKLVIGFAERVATLDPATAKSYSPNDTFVVNELISHPTLGLGIVSGVRLDKVEIAFKTDIKTLVHGRGGQQAERPAFRPAAARSGSPADKPISDSPSKPSVAEMRAAEEGQSE